MENYIKTLISGSSCLYVEPCVCVWCVLSLSLHFPLWIFTHRLSLPLSFFRLLPPSSLKSHPRQIRDTLMTLLPESQSVLPHPAHHINWKASTRKWRLACHILKNSHITEVKRVLHRVLWVLKLPGLLNNGFLYMYGQRNLTER